MKKMAHKIIWYFSQCTDSSNDLIILTIILDTGNLKECLTKKIISIVVSNLNNTP